MIKRSFLVNISKFLIGFSVFVEISVSHHLHAAPAYAQLTSLITQIPPTGGNTLIRMETIDEIKNLELSPSRDKVIIKESGIYFILSGAEVGALSADASGYLDIWFVKNGIAVPNSNSRMSVDQPLSNGVLVTQAVMQLNAGDTIGTSYSASGPSLGFVFIQPDNEPAVTSLTFSILKIDNVDKEK